MSWQLEKYTDLANERKTLWQARKVDIIPIAVSALELFEKNTKIDLTNIDIVDDFKDVQQKKTLRAFMNIV